MRVIPHQPEDLEHFWSERVNDWLLKGVRVAVSRKINIPAATLIFCYIDFFGSLMLPNADPRTRFYEFVEKYLKPINEKYDMYKCMLYEDYRCGLVHEAVMKKGTGIFRSDDPQDKGYSHFGIRNGALFLDLIQLKSDLITSVKHMKKDLNSDKALRTKAIKRLRDLEWTLQKEPA